MNSLDSRRRFTWAGVAAWGVVTGALAATVFAQGPHIAALFRTTALLALSVAAISVPVGTLLGLLLVRTRLPGKKWLLLAIVSMCLVPLYLHAAGWAAGFGRGGWYSMAQGALEKPWLDGFRATVWIHAMAAIPWVVGIVATSFHWMSPVWEEQALLEGSAWRTMWRVTLRLAWGPMVLAAGFVALLVAGEMTVTDVYGVRTYAEVVFTDFAMGTEVGAITQTHWLEYVFLAWLTVLAGLLAMGMMPVQSEFAPAPPVRFDLGGRRWWVFGIVLLLLAILLGVPLVNLVYSLGVRVDQLGGERVRTWSAYKCLQWLVPGVAREPTAAIERYADEFSWSAACGLTCGTLTVLLSTPWAWLARTRRAWAAMLLVVAAVCWAVPGPLLGIFLKRCGDAWVEWTPGMAGLRDWTIWLVDRSVLLPAIAMSTKAFPLAACLSWLSFRALPLDILESAETEGAGVWSRFWMLAVRQRWPTLLALLGLTFGLAVGDLSASNLVMPVGRMTVAQRVFDFLHFGVQDHVAALCLTGLGLFLVGGMVCVKIYEGAWFTRSRSEGG